MAQDTRQTSARDHGGDVNDHRLGELMARAQTGDRAAYARLLRDCEPIIRKAARRAGLSGDTIDDAIQETLLTLHNARQTYDPTRSFTAWLTTIAQRRAIDVRRRTGRNERREVHAPLVYESHADETVDPTRGWEDAGRAGQLKAAISTLSPSQREAIEEIGLADRSLSEAAAVTGKTTGALKVNFHRAMKVLRGRLGGDPDV